MQKLERILRGGASREEQVQSLTRQVEGGGGESSEAARMISAVVGQVKRVNQDDDFKYRQYCGQRGSEGRVGYFAGTGIVFGVDDVGGSDVFTEVLLEKLVEEAGKLTLPENMDIETVVGRVSSEVKMSRKNDDENKEMVLGRVGDVDLVLRWFTHNYSSGRQLWLLLGHRIIDSTGELALRREKEISEKKVEYLKKKLQPQRLLAEVDKFDPQMKQNSIVLKGDPDGLSLLPLSKTEYEFLVEDGGVLEKAMAEMVVDEDDVEEGAEKPRPMYRLITNNGGDGSRYVFKFDGDEEIGSFRVTFDREAVGGYKMSVVFQDYEMEWRRQRYTKQVERLFDQRFLQTVAKASEQKPFVWNKQGGLLSRGRKVNPEVAVEVQNQRVVLPKEDGWLEVSPGKRVRSQITEVFMPLESVKVEGLDEDIVGWMWLVCAPLQDDGTVINTETVRKVYPVRKGDKRAGELVAGRLAEGEAEQSEEEGLSYKVLSDLVAAFVAGWELPADANDELRELERAVKKTS